MSTIRVLLLCLITVASCFAQKNYHLSSPDGQLRAEVKINDKISYAVYKNNEQVLDWSALSVQLENNKAWGKNSHVKKAETKEINQQIISPLYKKNTVPDSYHLLKIDFKEGFSIEFRMYNDGVAYRFVSTKKKDFTVVNEQAEYNFTQNHTAYIPYVKDGKGKTIDAQFSNSFENTYTKAKLSEFDAGRIAFSPIVVATESGTKLAISESNLRSYPGMFLANANGKNQLKGVFAPYPKETIQGGYNMLQQPIQSRENFIAKCKAGTDLPWRILIISTDDKSLLNNDMVYKLANPSEIKDTSWIKPGKVAWEWWNHWGLYNVDFKAGVNNETYMAYIDFASQNKIEYVILDEGWSVKLKADLFQVVPEIDLKKLVAYAKEKNVGLILWAGYYAFERDMEKVCRHYSEMGIKGFKIDFMDRDDQQMVDFHYKAAAMAAKYKLLVDFHGTYKPTGLNRTFPNVINYEAVHGLEQMKWSDIRTDQVTYDVTMPFIRMLAGPVDYTQGAMRNGTKKTYRNINEEPMSQGTRCHQLAEYVVFESPLSMLCDSPDNYRKSQDCIDYIAAIPTVWDTTVSLNGSIGEYIAIARQKGTTWYVGAITNWDARILELDLSFLKEGDWQAEIFKDGSNADNIASDYKKETIDIPASRKLSITMAPGGGYAMKIYKKQK